MCKELKNEINLEMTFKPMSVKPVKSDEYIVIWHNYSGDYELVHMSFSKRYNMWNVYDSANDAVEAVKNANIGIKPNMCIGWAKLNVEQLILKLQEEDEF